MSPTYRCMTYAADASRQQVYTADNAANALQFVKDVQEGLWVEYAGIKFALPAFGPQIPIVWAEIVVITRIS